MYLQRNRVYASVFNPSADGGPRSARFGLSFRRGPGLPFRVTLGMGFVAVTLGLLSRRAGQG